MVPLTSPSRPVAGSDAGETRSSAARSTSTAWGRSSWRGRLRWMRSPRSTWARRSGPEALGQVDQQPELDAVAAGEAELLEDPAVGGRLAGQGLAHPRELGEEQLEHRAGHQLGDPAATGGVTVQGPGVEALDQGDVVGGQQRPEQPGDEGRGRVGDVGVEEGDEVARTTLRAPPPWPGPCRRPRPGPAPPVPRRPRPGSAVSSLEPSSSTITSSTRPLPPCPARNGWTTARTTDPTVEASSRAGMHTDTVRSERSLAARTRSVGKSPC